MPFRFKVFLFFSTCYFHENGVYEGADWPLGNFLHGHSMTYLLSDKKVKG